MVSKQIRYSKSHYNQYFISDRGSEILKFSLKYLIQTHITGSNIHHSTSIRAHTVFIKKDKKQSTDLQFNFVILSSCIDNSLPCKTGNEKQRDVVASVVLFTSQAPEKTHHFTYFFCLLQLRKRQSLPQN